MYSIVYLFSVSRQFDPFGKRLNSIGLLVVGTSSLCRFVCCWCCWPNSAGSQYALAQVVSQFVAHTHIKIISSGLCSTSAKREQAGPAGLVLSFCQLCNSCDQSQTRSRPWTQPFPCCSGIAFSVGGVVVCIERLERGTRLVVGSHHPQFKDWNTKPSHSVLRRNEPTNTNTIATHVKN